MWTRFVRWGLHCMVYRPYLRRLGSLIICRCHYKESNFSSVILRPWVLVRLEFELTTSRSADRWSPNWVSWPAVGKYWLVIFMVSGATEHRNLLAHRASGFLFHPSFHFTLKIFSLLHKVLLFFCNTNCKFSPCLHELLEQDQRYPQHEEKLELC